MNRELVDFYNQNNYELYSINAGHRICQTILNAFPALNIAIRDVLDVENRLMKRNVPARPWVSYFYLPFSVILIFYFYFVLVIFK